MQVPNVSMNPTLEAIQEAINSTAKTILQVRAPAAALGPVAVRLDQPDLFYNPNLPPLENPCSSPLPLKRTRPPSG
jgi:hypothetical protein